MRRGLVSAMARRFSPVGQANGATKSNGTSGDISAPRLRGVVFDVDGTLCEPQNYMFAEMRAALGNIPKTTDILEHIHSLPTPAAQEEAMEKIRTIERQAMKVQTPQPGLTSLMAYLDTKSLPKAICTRNFAQPVHHLLDKFLPTDNARFWPIVTRDFKPPKPHPAGILHIAQSWGLFDKEVANKGPEKATAAPKISSLEVDEKEEEEEEKKKKKEKNSQPVAAEPRTPTSATSSPLHPLPILMVGDSIDDLTAGRLAGAATVLLVNPANEHLAKHPFTDSAIRRLDELIGILEEGFVGREHDG